NVFYRSFCGLNVSCRVQMNVEIQASKNLGPVSLYAPERVGVQLDHPPKPARMRDVDWPRLYSPHS
ncbi:hypothetical protein ILYODFUR_018133, partial [Ilyodon furcidens]